MMPTYEELVIRNKELEKQIENILSIEKMLSQIFYHSQVATEIYDENGKLINCNPACLSMFGIDNIDIVKGFNLFEDPNLSIENINDIKSGKEIRFELNFDFELVKKYNLYKTSKTGQFVYDCIIRPVYLSEKIKKGYLVLLIDITKQKQTEQKFISYINHALDGVFIADETGNYLEVNPAASVITGYTQTELCKMNIVDLIPENARLSALEHFNNVKTLGKFSGESQFIKKDNSLGYWIVDGIKLNDNRFLGFVKDITERKKNELLAKQNNDRLNILLSLSQMTNFEITEIYNFALEKAIELCNSKIGFLGFLNDTETRVSIYSWSAAAMQMCEIGDKYIDFEVANTGIWGEVIRQRKPLIINNYKADNPLKRGVPAGHVEIFNYLSIPVFDNNKIVAVIAVANKNFDYNQTDVQELNLLMEGVWNILKQRNYENELRIAKIKAEESQKKFKAIADTSPLAIYISKGIQQIAEYINPTFYKLFGYSYEEVSEIARWWPLAYPNPDYQKQVSEEWNIKAEKAIQHKSDIEPMETIVSCKDGTKKNILWGFVSTGDENWAFGMDLTAYKNAEKALKIALEKAEESDRLKTSFLNNMSHEVRTPLNAIQGFSQLITKPNQSPEKLLTFSKLITESTEKLISIITDVIEMSQIQTKQVQTKTDKIEIASLVSGIYNDFKNKISNKDIDFKLNINLPTTEIFINSDRPKLTRILLHLVDNAIKFTAQGTVEISCNLLYTEQSENILLIVADTGIGISPEMQQIIFEPFRQVETDITRNYGGNGLGLALVKAYTELLGGTISLQSEIKKGTIFTISLPLNNHLNKGILKQKNISIKNIKTVLIAEDEYTNYLYIVELLDEFGLKILYAENGQKALDLCQSNTEIDLVLMDIKMPIMDGEVAAKFIKEFRPSLPIIAQTAYAMESEKEKYSNIFDDYITKPINHRVFSEKIKKIINKLSD